MTKVSSVFASTLLFTTALTSAAAVAQEAAPEARDEIVVRGVFIPDEKRATSEVSNILDPIEFQRTGDGDIAGALQRVTGLSTSTGGDFVFVRGLNERYQNALLNGLPLPSPEPLRRVTPLDLFGTSVVEGLLVQKTFSPEYPGEFGGGVIDIDTKAVPDETFAELTFKIGGDTESNLKGDQLTHGGDGTDWLGLDGDLRDLPAPLAAVFSDQRSLSSPALSDAEIQEIGRSLPTSPLNVVQEGATSPEAGFSFAAGSRKYFGNGLSVGFVASVGFDSDWDNKRGVRQQAQSGAGGALELNRDFTFESAEYTAEANAHVTAGVEFPNGDTINFTGLLVNKSTRETRVTEGLDEESDTVRNESFEYIERTVWTSQIYGQHFFFPSDSVVLDWGVSWSEADREAPFNNSNNYIQQTDGAFRAELNLSSQTNFSNLADQTFAARADLAFPLQISAIDGDVKAGWSKTENSRSVFARNFGWDCGGAPGELLERRIDFIIADQNIGPDRCEFLEIDDSPGERNSYQGELDINAFYFGADADIGNYFRFAGGVRFEDSEQAVDIIAVSDPGAAAGIETQIDEDYALPSVTATWNAFENVQLRAGWSQTVTRPQFRELGETPFIDTRTDLVYVGNPNLVNSEIDNFDARWEWYFGRDQFLTLGGFYKEIENPIEEQVVPFRDASAITFTNSNEAKLWGFEFEFKKIFALEDLGASGFLSNKDLVVNLNYTYSDSEVETTGSDDGRSLQGQSKHLANAVVGIEGDQSRLMLLTNFQGERLRNVGFGDLPAVFEKPVTSIDLIYGRNFNLWNADYEFRFETRNLLGDDYEAFQEDEVTRFEFDSYDVGRQFLFKMTRYF